MSRAPQHRIQSRAIRRAGELLAEIQPDKGGRPKTGTASGTSSRERAAEQAGLSKRQKDTALRVAAVPEPVFERAVAPVGPPWVLRVGAPPWRGFEWRQFQGVSSLLPRATVALGKLRGKTHELGAMPPHRGANRKNERGHVDPSKPRERFRRLIERRVDDLGEVLTIAVKTAKTKGGRPGHEYWRAPGSWGATSTRPRLENASTRRVRAAQADLEGVRQ